MQRHRVLQQGVDAWEGAVEFFCPINAVVNPACCAVILPAICAIRTFALPRNGALQSTSVIPCLMFPCATTKPLSGWKSMPNC